MHASTTRSNTRRLGKLARILRMTEPQVVELARHSRLPFTVTGSGGLHVHSHDFGALAHSCSAPPALKNRIGSTEAGFMVHGHDLAAWRIAALLSNELLKPIYASPQAVRDLEGTIRPPAGNLILSELYHPRRIEWSHGTAAPSRGTRSRAISRRRERRAKFTSSLLGSSRSSGFSGTRATATPSHRAMRSRSASSQASTARTAMRKHIFGDGLGSHC
jgi:hypothetical protein